MVLLIQSRPPEFFFLSFTLKSVHLGPVSPTTVNFNRWFSPHFNLQLA